MAKDISRGQFLKYLGLIAGAVAVPPAANALFGSFSDKSLENKVSTNNNRFDIALQDIGRAFTDEAQAYQMPSDATLEKWMSQPVETTLAGTKVKYVTDSTYQKEVFGSDKPVMVLFYNNKGAFSKGDTVLSKIITEMFPQIKLCAYKISEEEKTPDKIWSNLKKNYPELDHGETKTPAILFYKKQNGKIVNAGEDYNLHGGYDSLQKVKDDIGYYKKHLPKIL